MKHHSKKVVRQHKLGFVGNSNSNTNLEFSNYRSNTNLEYFKFKIYIRAFVHSYIRTLVPSCIRIFVHSYVCTSVHSYIRTCIPSNIRTFIPLQCMCMWTTTTVSLRKIMLPFPDQYWCAAKDCVIKIALGVREAALASLRS